MGVQAYDITHYQPVLFAARSWGEVLDEVGGFFDTATDESIEHLRHASSATV
jgi:phenylalanine-4-hydroxylase